MNWPAFLRAQFALGTAQLVDAIAGDSTNWAQLIVATLLISIGSFGWDRPGGSNGK